uniref:Uncharacterized protein n=1 Tax=Entomoneis paludosa TaxID=265537 RepID=A0A6U3B134_9STRA|mmetsp:Transcript_2754/g.5590  ORF Transcript_2754/g.5590 Transcript_2754/m.5590 type:complete len:179 (+) Transcript_2754:148-684(+)|eukprot:CAMPEP_0172469772 /NCGR_PEP_ID=MMETSP1065-20121228/64601_1 /TAXON_ID=265537 /ORGANISM="Amphiprora paludosa, Strain CCMP125" /LENGTH=178 /DNA_ID=CAMNT_0013227525 /DNA_START=94 /DNA_END=630 /DNA_ORIENTATION=-
MNRSSYHGKLGPSDESTAEISLSSINTEFDFLTDRLHGSLDMDKHSRKGLSRHSGLREQRLEAISATGDEEDEEGFQDSFAVDDGSSHEITAQAMRAATESFLIGDNYVSDVEEETEDFSSSSSPVPEAIEAAPDATTTSVATASTQVLEGEEQESPPTKTKPLSPDASSPDLINSKK